MPWQKYYETGIESIDIQHQRLFNRLEKTQALVNLEHFSEKDKEEIRKVLADLENYVATHFTLEERLMEDNNYPNLREHISEHEQFTERIRENISKIDEILAQDDSHIRDFLKELTHFLEKWLNHHILGSDKAYVPYIHSEH